MVGKQPSSRGLGRRNVSMEPVWDFCLLITVTCSLGFPGNLEAIIPGPVNAILTYAPFLLQIALMILSSGVDFLDIQLLSLKKKYIPAYVLLVSWFAISMISTSFPKEQIVSCVRFSVTALFALWIVDRYDIHHILEITYYAGLVILFFTVVCMVIMPGKVYTFENGEKSFCGLYSTKNPCATELSFELVIHALLLKDWRKNKHPLPRFFVLSLTVHLGMMIFSKGMSALFCAAVPVVYMFMLEGKGMFRGRLQMGIIHVGVSVGFLVFAMTVLPLFKPLFDAIGKDVTLTGRTPMWEQLINVMTNHNSFTGFGFTMFWKDEKAVKLFHEGFRRNTWGNTMTYGAHNTLLEMWLDVGLLGIAAYFFMFIFSFRNPERMSLIEYDFTCSFVIWQTIKGLTERSYIPLHYQTLFLFLTVGVASSAFARKREGPRFRSLRGAAGETIAAGNTADVQYQENRGQEVS